MAHRYLSGFALRSLNNGGTHVQVLRPSYSTSQWCRAPGGYNRHRLIHHNTTLGYPKQCLYASSYCSKLDEGHVPYSKWHKSKQRCPCSLSFNPSLNNIICIRPYHISSVLCKDKSAVEKSVEVLTDQLKDVKSDKGKAEEIIEAKPKKSLWQRFVVELKHYYHGFRLLVIDVRVCVRLCWGVLHGKTLSRREYRQLIRTTADLFRLVPFLVMLIIPFMEFALPVVLKLFPNMLPSTFKAKDQEEKDLKNQLKIKLDMAQFLTDTMQENAVQGKGKKGEIAEQFSTFLNKVRNTGQAVSSEEILKYAKWFEDEFTLDTLNRKTLLALCRVLNLSTIGNDAILRFRLQLRLRQLKNDDKMIVKDGIDSLTVWELQSACRARGMRALGMPETRLKYQLQQWLDMSLKNIPASLLLLSRTFYLPENLTPEEQLKTTISVLPESSATGAKIKLASATGEKIDNKAKLELIREEEEAIRQEQMTAAEEARAEEQAKRETEEAEAIVTKMSLESDLSLNDTAVIMEAKSSEEMVDKARPIEVKEKEEVPEEEFTSKDLEEIEEALEDLAQQKQLSVEAEELQDLKEDISEYQENMENLRSLIVAVGGSASDITESKIARRLTKRVNRLIAQSDNIIGKLHDKKDIIKEEIKAGETEMKESPQRDDEEQEVMRQDISDKKDSLISINEMVLALKRLQKMPDDTRLQKIAEVLDEDKDGKIDITHVLKVIELLSRENMKLNASQVAEVVDMLKREDELDEDEKLREKQEKEKKNATKTKWMIIK